MTRIALMVAVGMGLMFISTTAFAQTCNPCDDKGKCFDPCQCDPKNCPPPPKEGADCSPGFYKNHVAAWCAPGSPADTVGIECQDEMTYSCSELVCLLSAEPPCKATPEERAFAKACLDANSPPTICSE